MSVREYYLSELSYLREQGREFSLAQPEAAPFLSEAGSDPDVERLLEGFAFLTGRLRQRLDDEEPVLTKGLLDLFMPAFLRPYPSVSLQQFSYAGGAVAEEVTVPRGTQVAGVHEEQRCVFTTTSSIDLVPLRVSALDIDRSDRPSLRLRIDVLDGLQFSDIVSDTARLHFVGDPLIAQCWRLCFLHLCNGLQLSADGNDSRTIPNQEIKAVGFGQDESVSVDAYQQIFKGFEQLIEYWHCPEKFQAVDLHIGSYLRSLGEVDTAYLTLQLKHLPAPMPTLHANDCQFNCVPAINCYEASARPLNLDAFQSRYRIRPEEEQQRCYAVQKVSARLRDGSGERLFHPMYHRLRGEDANYAYHALPDMDGRDWQLRLAGADLVALIDGIDVLSLDILVTDGEAPLDYSVGEINRVISESSGAFETKNLQRPTRPAEAPRADDAYWRLLGKMSLNYRSIRDIDDLRQLLRVFHFAALTDRDAERRLSLVLDAMHDIQVKSARRLVHGALVSGIEVTLTIDDERIGGDGPVHLLGSVLANVLSHMVTINSYSRLQVVALRSQERYTWPVYVGRRSRI